MYVVGKGFRLGEMEFNVWLSWKDGRIEMGLPAPFSIVAGVCNRQLSSRYAGFISLVRASFSHCVIG